MSKHNHGATANTISSFETFIGCKVTGVICMKPGSRTLVFACGWGLTINSNGAFWTEDPAKIVDARAELRTALAKAGA
jgi:hypothetical protein